MAHQENQEMVGNVHQALQPMVLRLRDEETRESALSALAYYIRQRLANHEVEMYAATSVFLYYSDRTMSILKEEVTRYITMMDALILSARSCQRLKNVLVIFQCMAANEMAKPDFVMNGYCNHLPRIIGFFEITMPEEILEDIREKALFVFDLLCQARDARIVWWILDNYLIDHIDVAMRHGRDRSRWLGTRILEALLEEHAAIGYIFSPYKPLLIYSLISTWDRMTFLAFTDTIPAEPLLHVFRCYRRLCTLPGAINTLLRQSVSLNMLRADSVTVRQYYPQITTLLDQVLHCLTL